LLDQDNVQWTLGQVCGMKKTHLQEGQKSSLPIAHFFYFLMR
jgi:hypothetical protein